MRRIIFFSLFLLLLVHPLSGLAAEKEVIYGFDRDFPPFSFVEKGRPTGFEIEILNAALKTQGLKPELRPMTWDEAQRHLADGRIQLTSGMARTPQRERQFHFAGLPTVALNILIFTKGQDGIRTLSDLRGRPVATQQGSLYQGLVEKSGATPLLFPTEKEALASLVKGDAAAFVGAGETARYNIGVMGWKGVRAVGTPIMVTSVHYVAAGGDPGLAKAVSQGLRTILDNGVYDDIYQRWFVPALSAGERNKLLRVAAESAAMAYAPYSRFTVGAAVLTHGGRIYGGCNVENAYLPLTSGALKVAILKAVSEGDGAIKAAVTLLPDGRAVAPAADERQLLYEFNRGAVIIMGPLKGPWETPMVSRLLPHPFDLR